jgi:radical SAM superfamily enzyme YgiQ (UPF0313 family)
MKIVGIEPKNFKTHVFSAFKLPRLAMPLLGTIFKNKGYKVKIFLEEWAPINENVIKEADVIMISTITPTANRAYELADYYKKKYKKIIIIGGPHVSFLADEALLHADFVIRGEGEKALLKLIENIERGSNDFSSIPNLSYKKDGEFYHNPLDENFVDLNSLPIPDFTLVEGYNLSKLKIYPISTSRGCPYNCIFCAVVPMFGRKYRFRSEDFVIEEIKNLKRVEHIFFYDDNFAADKERAKILLEKMIKMNFKGTWSTQVRIDIYKDEELLKLMQKSNCSTLYIGFESINPETLKLYKKGITPAQIEEGIKILHKYNIKVHGMFVIGADTDTRESILATLDFSKKMKIDSVQFLILTPAPGSKIFQEFLKEGRIFTTNWDYYDGHHVVFYPKNMSPFELQELAFKLFEGFYSYKGAIKYLLKLDWIHATIHFLGTKLTKKARKERKEFTKNLSKI